MRSFQTQTLGSIRLYLRCCPITSSITKKECFLIWRLVWKKSLRGVWEEFNWKWFISNDSFGNIEMDSQLFSTVLVNSLQFTTNPSNRILIAEVIYRSPDFETSWLAVSIGNCLKESEKRLKNTSKKILKLKFQLWNFHIVNITMWSLHNNPQD